MKQPLKSQPYSKKISKMADFMARNVLLFFWDEGKMGYSRKIKRCFVSCKPIQ